MRQLRSRRAARIVPFALVALLAGCASTEKNHAAQIAELLELLPGEYDNLAQYEADVAAGKPVVHEALRLSIVVVESPLVEDHVLYVEERDANDERRVFSQRVWILVPGEKDVTTQLVYQPSEPLRWRGAGSNPDLLRSMLLRDLVPEQGCALSWKRTATGFQTSGDSSHCRVPARDGKGTWQHQLTWSVSKHSLETSESFVNGAGRAVPTTLADPVYRFARKGS